MWYTNGVSAALLKTSTNSMEWMFYGFFGCAVTLFGVFAIPTSLGKTAQYAWFFIAYTLLNAVFYTANNIAYAALTSLVTKNAKAC